jgi:protein-L-isoaspartate(D-aspartate) O-methyltransferase
MATEPDFERMRATMVREQLVRRGITDDGVLDAMGCVPREAFVPEAVRARAYADCAQPAGLGQTISQPIIVALMTQALELGGAQGGTLRVLEIGTGTGYQTAILCRLAAHVWTVERVMQLSATSGQRLASLGRSNVSLRIGDGSCGWPEHAPYDRIIVTAAAPHRPDILLSQLAPDGIAVAPVGGRTSQRLTQYRPKPGGYREKVLCGCVFVPLIGREGW